MDKQAFKQRMQNLKSYRENNPGKGYWDWKIQSFIDGGENSKDGGYSKDTEQSRLNTHKQLDPTMRFSPEALVFDNQAKGEEEAYWATYNGLGNFVPNMDSTAVTPWDKQEEAKKEIKSDFFGTTERMDVNIQALADTLQLHKIYDNYDQYKNNMPGLPSKDGIRKAYETAQKILNNPNKYQQVNADEVVLRPNTDKDTNEYNPLGMLRNFGLKWNPKEKALYMHDTYDFPWYAKVGARLKGVILRDRPREMKIRSKINFDPQIGSVLLRDSTNYNSNYPELYKASQFENGGETNEFQRKTRRDIMQESLVDERPDYDKMFQNQNEYQKDFANYWYTERAKNPKYSDQIGGDKLNTVLSNVSRATWKTPTEAMRDNMVGQGYNPTDAQINQQLNVLKEKGIKGFANPKAYSYTSLKPTNTWHEGIGHIVGDNTPSILKANPNVYIQDANSEYQDYVNQANEKHAQTWDFRGNNSNLKDDQGNYYIDPNRQLTPEDIKDMRSKGAKIPEQWESLEDADISELTNTFAYNLSQDPIQYMATGGEVGNTDDEFAKAVNTKLGRTPDGRPLQQGLKPVFDLEDAANMTPVGDVLSARDVYNAARSNDWTSAGLAAAAMIPFVPMTVKQFRKKYKGVTPKSTYSSDSKLMDKKIQDRIMNLKQKKLEERQ